MDAILSGQTKWLSSFHRASHHVIKFFGLVNQTVEGTSCVRLCFLFAVFKSSAGDLPRSSDLVAKVVILQLVHIYLV